MGGRVILILVLVIAATAIAGWWVRGQDRIAAGLLFGLSGFIALLVVGAFFGFLGAP